MKRFKMITIIIAALVVLSQSIIYTPRVIAAQPTVILNGQVLSFDVPPTIQNGRTLVPMSGIFNALGASISWKAETRTVTAFKGNTAIAVQIDNPIANVNESPVQLDTPAQIINGRTMVPLGFVSIALGCQVSWDPGTSTITITGSGGAVPSDNSGSRSSNNDASILIGTWVNQDYAGELVDPVTGFIQGSNCIGDFYDFRADGTCRHVMVASTPTFKGLLEVDSNYVVSGNQITFTNCRQTLRPSPDDTQHTFTQDEPTGDTTSVWEYKAEYNLLDIDFLPFKRI